MTIETQHQASILGKSDSIGQYPKYDHVDLRVRVANASVDTVVQVKVAGSLVLIADPESPALTLLRRNPIRRVADVSQSISVVVPPRDASVAILPFELDPPLDSSRLFRGDVKSFLAELSAEQVRVVRWNSETAATFADLKNKYLALGASLPGELACAAEACDSALHEAQVLSELTVSSLGGCPEFWAGAGAFDARRDPGRTVGADWWSPSRGTWRGDAILRVGLRPQGMPLGIAKRRRTRKTPRARCRLRSLARMSLPGRRPHE